MLRRRFARVLIVGGSSSGKSTVGRRLAEKLSCDYFDLDQIAFADDQWTLRDIADRRLAAVELAKRDAWVAEGGHIGWTEPLMAAADRIIWLDPSPLTALWRTWRRHRSQALGFRVARLAWLLRWYVRTSDQDVDRLPSRRSLVAALAPYQGKVHRLSRTGSVSELPELE